MWVTGYTLLQENVEDEMRGRTFGSLTVVARLALFLALTLFPSLAAIVGPRVVRIGGPPSRPLGDSDRSRRSPGSVR